MILKNGFKAALCAGLLAWAGLSSAAEYRPGEFLNLDLSKAVLSPKPLGPPGEFAPVPVEADSANPVAQARSEPKPIAGSVVRKNRVAARAEKPRGAARVKLARRHSNPLDAQASDRRIQVWPCNTGGICNWQH
ncbi:MAG: hypothetical protein ABI192_18840 [Bradyrhizobium sp.]